MCQTLGLTAAHLRNSNLRIQFLSEEVVQGTDIPGVRGTFSSGV